MLRRREPLGGGCFVPVSAPRSFGVHIPCSVPTVLGGTREDQSLVIEKSSLETAELSLLPLFEWS